MASNVPDKLEELERSRYSRKGVGQAVDDAVLPERHFDAPEEWKKDELMLPPEPSRPLKPILWKMFIAAALFFVVNNPRSTTEKLITGQQIVKLDPPPAQRLLISSMANLHSY